MDIQEFNALPAEARRYIELHAGCLSCGNPAGKLTRAYELYKAEKMARVYQLFGGGINYVINGKGGILYNISDQDSDFEKREKLAIAEKIYDKNPEVFISYDKKGIAELLESLEPAKVVDLGDSDETWSERSQVLGIDTKSADYETLKAYSESKKLEPKGKKKVDYIEVIDAIDTELL